MHDNQTESDSIYFPEISADVLIKGLLWSIVNTGFYALLDGVDAWNGALNYSLNQSWKGVEITWNHFLRISLFLR